MKRRQAVKIAKARFNIGPSDKVGTERRALEVARRLHASGRIAWVAGSGGIRAARMHGPLLNLPRKIRRICAAVKTAGRAALDQYLSANRKPFEKLSDEAAAAILAHLPPGSTIVTTEEPTRPGGRSYTYGGA